MIIIVLSLLVWLYTISSPALWSAALHVCQCFSKQWGNPVEALGALFPCEAACDQVPNLSGQSPFSTIQSADWHTCANCCPSSRCAGACSRATSGQFSRHRKCVGLHFPEDDHPDATALRLMLMVAVRFGKDQPLWEPHEEFEGYARRLPHITAGCQLSRSEELEVARTVKLGMFSSTGGWRAGVEKTSERHTLLHTHTHTRTHTNLRTFTHSHTLLHTHTHFHTLSHTFTHTYTLLLTRTHTYSHVHTRTHTYTHVHTRTHTYTHVHTRTHTYTHVHTHLHKLTHTLTHTYTHSYTFFYTGTHTYTLLHTLSHTGTLTYTLFHSLTHIYAHLRTLT